MGKKNKNGQLPFMGNKMGPHPRNIYQSPPNIKQLAIQFPQLRSFVQNDLSGKVTINYKDRNALFALVKLLLKKDFDLNLELPDDRLVPVLPLRLNYLLWIEDLLKMMPSAYINEPEKVCGIDIGAGASCIYCLLAARQCKWNMLATELDEINFEYMQRNIELNCLQDKITAKKVNDGTFLVGAVDENSCYDFCMCNPPFYSSEEELPEKSREKDRTDHRPLPKSVCTGSLVEVVAPGGEVAFINSIINDSKTLGQKVKIYTTMMGHRKTLNVIGPQLLDLVGVEHMVVTTFQQGHVTRWGIAWTFDASIKFSDGSEQRTRSRIPKPPIEFVYNSSSLEAAIERIRFLLERIQIIKSVIKKGSEEYVMELKAYEATWQNQRKRRREEMRMQEMKRPKVDKDSEDAVTVPLNVVREVTADSSSNSKTLLLNAIVILQVIDNNKNVKVQMSPVDGTSNWDSVHQVMTYLKNHWDRDLVKLP